MNDLLKKHSETPYKKVKKFAFLLINFFISAINSFRASITLLRAGYQAKFLKIGCYENIRPTSQRTQIKVDPINVVAHEQT
jgi:hypothetical protein